MDLEIGNENQKNRSAWVMLLLIMFLVFFTNCGGTGSGGSGQEQVDGRTVIENPTPENIRKYLRYLAQLDPNGDEDKDGLTNFFEIETLKLKTLPDVEDTSGDGINDDAEDPDGDGLTNLEEQTLFTDPLKADTDQDGINDMDEVNAGLNPLSKDTDNDKLADNDEYVVGTDPLNSDTNNNGVLDGDENYQTTQTASNGTQLEVNGAGNAAATATVSPTSQDSVTQNIPELIYIAELKSAERN